LFGVSKNSQFRENDSVRKKTSLREKHGKRHGPEKHDFFVRVVKIDRPVVLDPTTGTRKSHADEWPPDSLPQKTLSCD
jgi:hypothetical protein